MMNRGDEQPLEVCYFGGSQCVQVRPTHYTGARNANDINLVLPKPLPAAPSSKTKKPTSEFEGSLMIGSESDGPGPEEAKIKGEGAL